MELEKNLAQHRVDERILRYKLQAYQKRFQISFIVIQQGQRYQAMMKRQKQGLMGQLRRKKYRLRNHKTLKAQQLKRRRYSQRYHKTLEEGVRKKNNQREFKNRKRWRLFQHQQKRYIQDTSSGNKTTNKISGGGDRNYRAKHTYTTIGFYVDWDYSNVLGETYV